MKLRERIASKCVCTNWLRKVMFCMLMVLVMLVAGCESRPPRSGPANSHKLTVVTSLTVLADLIAQVGGSTEFRMANFEFRHWGSGA